MNKKLLIGFLTFIIAVSWGYGGYHYLYPQSQAMSPEEQSNIVVVVTHMCPHQLSLYEQLLQDDGTILVSDAEHLLYQCNTEMKADMFYNALVREFKRNAK